MTQNTRQFAVASLLTGLALVAPPSMGESIAVRHLYTLSDFSGPVPYNGGTIVPDPTTDEIYVSASNEVRVFNGAGMEIYRFGREHDGGLLTDLAIDERGDILVLSRPAAGAGSFEIERCNYRGDFKETIALAPLPEEFEGFTPDRMFYRGARLYLASRQHKRVVVTDPATGAILAAHDLNEILELSEKERTTTDITGMDVDDSGRIVLTIATLFRAYVISRDGQATSFGEPGSTPGSFSVVADIATDGRNFYVADKGRSVVMIFNERFEFLTEFGHYGDDPDSLVRPNDLAVDPAGRIYVTQMKNRGVSAFSVSYR